MRSLDFTRLRGIGELSWGGRRGVPGRLGSIDSSNARVALAVGRLVGATAIALPLEGAGSKAALGFSKRLSRTHGGSSVFRIGQVIESWASEVGIRTGLACRLGTSV